MPFTLTMPKLSPTMEEGTITKWHKKVGDFVEAGEVLIEVATDKATVEYSALDEGWLRKVIITEGNEAIVNQAIAVFTEEKEESIDSYKPEGIEIQEAVVEVASESAAVTQSQKPKAKAVTGVMQQPVFAPEPPLENYSFPFPTESQEGRVLASPMAKRLAKEKGLDLTTVRGSGPSGRIVKEDLDKAQADTSVAFGRRDFPKVAPGTFSEEKMSPMRKSIGERLQESKTFIPHYYVTKKINVAAMVQARQQLKNMGVNVTLNDFILRAAALSLREHPQINTGYNSEKNAIVHYESIDISVAVSVDGGLITPIVRHADYKNMGQISVEVRSLAKKARDGKLEPHEYKGGSFTVSNLGMFGVDHFTAIINPPQAAIMAVGGIIEEAIVAEGKLIPGKTMKLTLSSDHRIIDGAAAASFLQTVCKYLENPASLLIA